MDLTPKNGWTIVANGREIRVNHLAGSLGLKPEISHPSDEVGFEQIASNGFAMRSLAENASSRA